MLALRGEVPLLARCAVGATFAAAAVWAALQAVDGVALKHAVDASADASGTDKRTRFANADVSLLFGIFMAGVLVAGLRRERTS